jgi:hypothetical protein
VAKPWSFLETFFFLRFKDDEPSPPVISWISSLKSWIDLELVVKFSKEEIAPKKGKP